jgi:hypothetical protein
MFYIADLSVIAVLKAAMTHLKENPDELEYILRGYIDIQGIAEMTGGQKYIKQIVEMITTGRSLSIEQSYTLDQPSNNALYVSASGSESTMFLGDFGTDESEPVEPIIYCTATAISANDKVINFSDPDKNVYNSIWKNLAMKQGKFTTIIADMFYHEDTKILEIHVDSSLPIEHTTSAIPLIDWKFTSPDPVNFIHTNASIDNVNITMFLRTTGDVEIHKLFALVVRYCVKKSRLAFEYLGLQVSSFSWQSPQPDTGSDDVIFNSTFAMNCKCTDKWIEYKKRSTDRVDLIVDPYQ